MGGVINCSLISAHFSINAYFLTAQTYKRMCLTTQVYGMVFMFLMLVFSNKAACSIYKLIFYSRGVTKSLILHVTFCACQCASSWTCVHRFAVLKLQDPQGISTSRSIILIAEHSHAVLLGS